MSWYWESQNPLLWFSSLIKRLRDIDHGSWIETMSMSSGYSFRSSRFFESHLILLKLIWIIFVIADSQTSLNRPLTYTAIRDLRALYRHIWNQIDNFLYVIYGVAGADFFFDMEDTKSQPILQLGQWFLDFVVNSANDWLHFSGSSNLVQKRSQNPISKKDIA